MNLKFQCRTADIIISAIGVPPTGPETTTCTAAANNVLSALRTLPPPSAGQKPLFITPSTTGVTNGPPDVPLSFAPIYHWLLANPHRDKKNMEKTIVVQTDDFVILRPSLLTDGKALGGRR